MRDDVAKRFETWIDPVGCDANSLLRAMAEVVQIATVDARKMKAHNRPFRRVPGAMS
jgi:hypothetical protein